MKVHKQQQRKGFISKIISRVASSKLFRTYEMRLARWKLENDSNTYDFICCPHNWGEYRGGGTRQGKGLQCAQLGDEMNKYLTYNPHEVLWS